MSSGIHINPKNKGKLTETAKRTGKSFEELAHSKNPLTRKRAVFALNARKWNHKHKHANGGRLYGIPKEDDEVLDFGICRAKARQMPLFQHIKN